MEDKEPTEAFRVAVKVPHFWPKKVKLWFHQLEAQFISAGVTQDSTKYGYVIANLDQKYVEETEDILEEPPMERKYERVKTALIERLSESTSRQMRKILEREEVGDRTPSRFLRPLRGMAGKIVPEEFLKELWLSHLPTDTQKALATTTTQTLDNLAEVADRIHEIHRTIPGGFHIKHVIIKQHY